MDRTTEPRQALLDSTIRLLNAKGYSGTTTEIIAAEGGVSRGARRYHFPDKLMAGVITHVCGQETRAYRQKVDALERSLRVAVVLAGCLGILAQMTQPQVIAILAGLATGAVLFLGRIWERPPLAVEG